MSYLLLPDEILSIICSELGHGADFGTLYQCARSAKTLADPALRTMYQFHELTPAFAENDEIELRQKRVTYKSKLAQQDLFFRRWTLLWRSIVASSMDEQVTYKPYCRYLRILDFRNLSQMLDDMKFSGKTRAAFFAAPLQHFHYPMQEGKRLTVDAVATVNHIGESVIPKAHLLEEISGQLSPGFLTRWISQSPRLRNMVLWDGNALANGAGAALCDHCNSFQNLTIREWRSPDADEVFARFLNELRPDTLDSFELLSYNNIGRLSFSALGRHKSLQELKLANLEREAMENLNQLKDCTELRSLTLHDNTGTVLNNTVFQDVVQWLSSCLKLKDISLTKFVDGPAILTEVALSPNVRWTKLSLEGYSMHQRSAAAFHSALSEQKDLRTLWLKGDGEDAMADDLNIMVDAIGNLPNLQDLALKDISDDFEEEHIIRLAWTLPTLEELWTSGNEVSAGVLRALTNLPNLKSLTLYALTQFKVEEILEFVDGLHPQMQSGFALLLMNVDPEFTLSDQEQYIIQDRLAAVNGRFEFVPFREDNFDTSDDD